MKNVVLILAMGLLLAGCTTAGGPGNVVKQQGDYIHLGWEGWHMYTHPVNLEKAATYCSSRDKYVFNFGDVGENSGVIYICSEKFLSESPISGHWQIWSNYPKELEEEGKLEEIRQAIEKSNKEEEKRKKEEEKKKQIKMTSMVDDAKSACKDIGHEEGTDRFEDCSLDLYKQSVALAAEKKQQIIYTGSSSSGSSSVTIYDPVRDANRAIDRGMKILTGQCGVSGLEC